MGVLDWGRPGLRAENWELGEFCALRLRPPHPHGCLQKGREPPSDSRRRSEGAAGEAEGGSSAAGVAAGCWAAVPQEQVAGGPQRKPPGQRDAAPVQHAEMGLAGEGPTLGQK